MKKRILATLLSLCLVIGLLPVTAMAAGDPCTKLDGCTLGAGHKGDCANGTQEHPWDISAKGDNVHAYLKDGTLTIYGTGAVKDFNGWYGFDAADTPWLKEKFSKVVVEDGVTRLGDFTLSDCNSVVSIQLGKDVSEFGTAALWSGYNDPGLSSITVSSDSKNLKTGDSGELLSYDGKVLHLVPLTVGENYAVPASVEVLKRVSFSAAHNLQYIDLANVKTIETYAFSGCALKQVTVPSTVTSIGAGTFRIGTLEEVNFDGKDLGTQTFWGCGNLKKITIGPNVKSLGSTALGDCNKLENVYFNSQDCQSGNLLQSCKASNVTIHVGTEVTKIPATFAKDFKGTLRVVFDSSSVPCSVGKQAFQSCSGLTKLEGDYSSRIETIGDSAFFGSGLTGKLTFGTQFKSIGISAINKTTIEEISLRGNSEQPIAMPAPVNDSNSVFNDVTSLKVARIGSLDKLPIGIFKNCSGLHTIDFAALPAEVSINYSWAGGPGNIVMMFGGVPSSCITYVSDAASTIKAACDSNNTVNLTFAITNGGTFKDDTTFTACALATPTKDGYKFAGWYSDDSFTESNKVLEDTALDAGSTYYAKWVKEISFDGNDSTSGSMDKLTVTEGDNSTKLTSNGFSKTGYTFTGWNTQADGRGTPYAADAVASTVPNDTTLYAQWEINKYAVTFKDGDTPLSTQSVEHGSKATMPTNPTKKGYEFAGWYNHDTVYDFSTPVTSNLALTAKWVTVPTTEPTKVIVTFDSNGGSAVAAAEILKDAVVAAPAAPTREGYTFAGWYNGETLYNFNKPVTEALTLTAKWDVNTYTVTWDVDGKTTTVEYAYGAAITLPTAPAKDGYTFTGWSGYTDGMTMPAGDVTFTAQWQQIYYGGGSSSSSNTSTSTTTNKDGSTTTTTTNKTTGTVTEVTKEKDGTTTTVETKKDGTVTETVKLPNGTIGTVVTDKNGEVTQVTASVSSTAARNANKTGEAVTLPVEVPAVTSTEDAPAVQVTVPKSAGSVKVEIPVEKVTPGTVAVIVKADGTEEIVKTSVLTEDGVVLKLEGSATVKVIDNAKDFSDTKGHWAEDAISFVTARGMFSGTTETTFAPDSAMTRAMLWTVLARFDGEDTTGGNVWYEKGMEWAKANGVSDGSNPNGSITREQLATMLWRYSGSPAVEGGLDRFSDADKVSGYAVDAMRWAVEIGLIDGIGNDTLAPQGDATRAQLATILTRYCENLAQ